MTGNRGRVMLDGDARRSAAEGLQTVVDPDDENEYYILNGGKKQFKFTKQQFSDSEVFQAGLLAGGAIEVARVVVTHPLDTIKTRLQAYNATAVAIRAAQQQTTERVALTPPPAVLLDRCWEGLGPALASSAPQGATFWAVKDVARREALAWLGVTSGQGTLLLGRLGSTPPLPAWAAALGLDWRGVATLGAVALGEAAYWLVRAPTEVAKISRQAQAPLEEEEQQQQQQQQQQAGDGGRGGDRGNGEARRRQPPAQQRAASAAAGGVARVFAAFPLLGLTDLPLVVTRTYLFLVLRANGGAALLLGGAATQLDAFTADLALYTLASVVANGLCTPLEVVRTRLLLQRATPPGTPGASSYEGILDALATISAEEGAAALFSGVGVRLLWNGVTVGAILAVLRLYYAPAQQLSLNAVRAIDAWAASLGSSLQELVRFLTLN